MIKKRILFFLVPPALLGGILFFALLTQHGAEVLLRAALLVYPRVGAVSFGSLEGTLAKQITLRNVRISDSPLLPPGSTLEIQRFDGKLNLPRLRLDLEVYNARLRLPGADSVVIFGTYRGGEIDLNVFAPRLALHLLREQILTGLPADMIAAISDADIFISGTTQRLRINGTFIVRQARRGPLILTDSSCGLDLEVRRPASSTRQLYGTVRLSNGFLAAPHGVRAELGESRLTFTGPLDAPLLAIKGLAFVQDTRISCSLAGTPSNPEIKLTSQPPLPQERLLLMLATGRKWTGVEGVLRQGSQASISADAIKEFIDFFILGGSGARSAGRLGIKDVSVTYNALEKGAALGIGLTGRFDARYGIKQTLDALGGATISQTVGGEYRVMDKVFMGAQQDMSQTQPAGVDTSVPEEGALAGNRTIYMKFKTEF